MNTARVRLPQWDCAVSVIDNRLCAGRSASDEEDDGSDDLLPVDFLCKTFLADASRALGIDFTPDEFDIVACDGCRAPEELPLRVTRTP
jgi:hypothetical protein